MKSRRIYISFVIEDAVSARRLSAVLEAAGVTIITAQPDAIATADSFVACFAAGPGVTARYNREELERAIDHSRGLPANSQWITLAKLTPCEMPSLAGISASAPILDLQEHWTESIAHLLSTPTAGATATMKFKAGQYLVGGDAEFTNVESAGDGSAGADVRSEVTIDTVVVDHNVKFTNLRH